MNLLTSVPGLVAVFLGGALVTTAAAAPFSTITTCTTTTVTTPSSPSATGLTPTTTPSPVSTSTTLTTTTTTTPSSTTTSFTTVTAPVPTGTTVPEYGQCGGLGYAGPTSCEGPLVCVCSGAWWCQCQVPAAAADEESELEEGGIPGTGPAGVTDPALSLRRTAPSPLPSGQLIESQAVSNDTPWAQSTRTPKDHR